MNQVHGEMVAERIARSSTRAAAEKLRGYRPWLGRRTVVLAAIAMLCNGMSAAQECAGDCDANRSVAVSELIRGVNIALGLQPVGTCLPFANAQGVVDIARLIAAVKNALEGCPVALTIVAPGDDMLVLAGTVAVQVDLPPGTDTASVAIQLDGADVTDQLIIADSAARGHLFDVTAGLHTLTASAAVNGVSLGDEVHFETVVLANPDECEVLNNVACLLPYPSSRFLVPDATTSTGFRVELPVIGMPVQNGAPLDPALYRRLDGFSPAGSIMMHFPGGVDVAASNAARLSPVTRSYDARSLDPDSPTVLLDADTGERILHFVELEARNAGTPDRQALFLHAGRSLTPGHRYIVAVRHLLRPDGGPVTPEAAFAALRDRRPSNIGAIGRRRAEHDRIFARLAELGIARDDLILAFDFVVQSDDVMTRDMLSMRDQAFAWLAEQEAAGVQTFAVTATQDLDCSAPHAFMGREVRGTFQVPLFLTSDPLTAPLEPARFNRGSDGLPAPVGITNPPFTLAIPCAALGESATPRPGAVLGPNGGLSGKDYVEGLIAAANSDFPFFRFPELVAVATDWSGWTPLEVFTFQLTILADLNLWQSYVDRVRQGLLNTLILTRMVHHASFNVDPAFRSAAGSAVLAAPGSETFYAGRSLGGTMGVLLGALSPDIERILIELPGSLALFIDRSSEFPPFVSATGISDPLEAALTVRLLSDAGAFSDLHGYATHVTADPLPGSTAKHVLVTMPPIDQEVSNLNVEWLARTMGIPNLEGSVLRDLPQIPDRPGPLASALVVPDIGAFDPNNPAHQPFIQPLANLPPAECSLCDPHGIPPVFVPAGAQQLSGFLTPGGVIENHCNGLCDGAEPAERAYNWPTRCEPSEPWFVPFDLCG